MEKQTPIKFYINSIIDGSIPIEDKKPDDPNYEYYYRRGNRLYFRGVNGKVAFTLQSIPKELKKGNKYLLKIE